MSNLDLCYLSATDAIEAFHHRRLKPSDLIEALIERIEQVNPVINALADTYFDEARAEALAADEAYANGTASGALLGVPVLVKDAQRIKGKRTTHGSLLYMDAAPDEMSDPMIERLQEAGAIILARTTVPEFCVSGVCRTLAWGNTVNPFNPDFGTGGSSGGSGAALAAGFAPIATGTDIGGSIRIPASCCGVVGFKPPHGRNPDGPPANFDRYNHCGPLARKLKIPIVGQYDLMSYWEEHEHLETIGFNKGGTVDLGGVKVTMVNAVHSSSFGSDMGPKYGGTECGYMIEGEGHTIYVSGDTDVMADMKIFNDLHAPDIGILCAGGHFTMDMKRAAYAAKSFFDFKTVIPCHYRTFPILEQSAELLKNELSGVDVIEPEVMQPISL